jgi:hypothetical protein
MAVIEHVPMEVHTYLNDSTAHGYLGNLYFTFQPANLAEDTQCLVKFKPDGTGGVLLGDKGASGLSQGVPHRADPRGPCIVGARVITLRHRGGQRSLLLNFH